MKRIWAPWRIQYIDSAKQGKPTGCILCDKPKQTDDAANCILFRGQQNFVMLNGYPYNPGHLMVSPYRHAAGLEELTATERNEHFEIVARCIKVLREIFAPSGLNIGINSGRAAGAGIEDHFHTHIVPRWQGDTNFMPVLADVRVLPEALADTYKKLQGKF